MFGTVESCRCLSSTRSMSSGVGIGAVRGVNGIGDPPGRSWYSSGRSVPLGMNRLVVRCGWSPPRCGICERPPRIGSPYAAGRRQRRDQNASSRTRPAEVSPSRRAHSAAAAARYRSSSSALIASFITAMSSASSSPANWASVSTGPPAGSLSELGVSVSSSREWSSADRASHSATAASYSSSSPTRFASCINSNRSESVSPDMSVTCGAIGCSSGASTGGVGAGDGWPASSPRASGSGGRARCSVSATSRIASAAAVGSSVPNRTPPGRISPSDPSGPCNAS